MVTTSQSGSIQSRDDYDDNPTDQHSYWTVELNGSERNLRGFLRQGDHVVDYYLSQSSYGSGRIGGQDVAATNLSDEGFRLNIYHSNVETLMASLYGNTPTVDVSRRFADSNDDVGRVAAEIMERLVNSEMSVNAAEVDAVLETGLQDRLTVGLGCSRVIYVAEFEEGPDGDTLSHENAYTEYVHWRDVRWGWARVFDDVPWIAFRTYLTQDEVSERFGKEVAEQLTYKVQQALNEESEDTTEPTNDSSSSWQKAEVWEIWDKTEKRVVWYSKGYDKILDSKDDPYQLTNFYPCPPFFIANTTSTLYVPTSDFHMAQDLYHEIDILQTRIAIITQAVRVVGVYDMSNGEIGRMLKEGMDNDLIPVENWALFGEKGGIAGQIDWLPLQDIVAALTELIKIRDQNIALLQQVTGMNDVMRGNLDNQYEGVGQTQIKAEYGSVRIQALQDDFAKYATGLMSIKAEIISRHFDGETIAKLSNAQYLYDQDLVGPAIELIKNPDQAQLSVKIRSESLAMVDYAKLKNERTEYITALATFMQSAAPLLEMQPATLPYLLQLLQWGLAGFKGASEIEGVLDKAIEAAEQAEKQKQEKPPEPTPEEKMQQADQQFQMQIEQMKSQAEIQKIQTKAKADIQVRGADLQADVSSTSAEHAAQMEEIKANMAASMAEIEAKMRADIQKEIAQAQANILQTQAAAESEVMKGDAEAETEILKSAAEAEIDIQTEATKTGLKIGEIAVGAEAKIEEAKAKVSNSEKTNNE